MYILDNADRQSVDRFDALAAMFDAGTIQHLQRRGVSEGWACLEVGAGGGSIARWLADRVGASGHVLATDIDTRHLEQARSGNLDIQRHDIAADALPESAFDLVHARLVLMHVVDGSTAMAKMIAALKPGGWLVVEIRVRRRRRCAVLLAQNGRRCATADVGSRRRSGSGAHPSRPPQRASPRRRRDRGSLVNLARRLCRRTADPVELRPAPRPGPRHRSRESCTVRSGSGAACRSRSPHAIADYVDGLGPTACRQLPVTARAQPMTIETALDFVANELESRGGIGWEGTSTAGRSPTLRSTVTPRGLVRSDRLDVSI